MANGIKNFFRNLGGVSDDEYYDDDEFYDDDDYVDDDDYEDEPQKGSGLFGRFKKSSKYEEDDDYEDDYEETNTRSSEKSSKITSIHKKSTKGSMDVRIIKPMNYDVDTQDIVGNLLENRTVILNLEGIDVALAQRIIDFSYGASCALQGNFRAVTKSILLITPSNVNILGVLDQVNESLNISED